MATDSRTIQSFEEVSRTVGVVFKYVLLAATLTGIVALAVLLGYVAFDAIQPQTAAPGWYLVFALTLVVPSLAVAAFLRRRSPASLNTGFLALGVPIVGLLFGGGAAALFVDIVPPLAWLGYVLAIAIAGAVVVGLERRANVPFLARLVVSLAAIAGSLYVVPGVVQGLPFVPTAWLILTLTVGLPLAAGVGHYVASRWESRRDGLVALAVTLGAITASAFVGPLVGVDSLPAVILTSFAGAPFGLYVTVVYRDGERTGLLFPAVVIGGAVLGAVLVDQLGFAGPASWVDWQFLTSGHANQPADAGMYPAIVGSIMLMIIVALVSFPVGVGAAVYLEEYAPDNRVTRLIKVNISNLAGVPSIVYGLLGLGLFIRYVGSPPGTVLVGGLTLALLILPIVIISTQEAVRSVPDSMRQASYGMGATRWQTVKNVVLPRSFAGILTGTILALGRAIGETAPLLVIGAPNIFDLPTELTSRVGAMPLQIYVWATAFASDEFYTKAIPAGVIVLLAILLTMNSVAIVLRNRYQQES